MFAMTSGCLYDTDNGSDNVSDEQPSEDGITETDQDIDIQSNDEPTTGGNSESAEDSVSDSGTTTPSDDIILSSGESNGQDSDAIEEHSVPQLSLKPSALGDGRYLIEHQGGDAMDLAESRLVLSSGGNTDVYSPITEDSLIMSNGDTMLIDINSGVFSINDQQISVTEPESTESSVGDTGIIFIDISSDKIIAYMTVSE